MIWINYCFHLSFLISSPNVATVSCTCPMSQNELVHPFSVGFLLVHKKKFPLSNRTPSCSLSKINSWWTFAKAIAGLKHCRLTVVLFMIICHHSPSSFSPPLKQSTKQLPLFGPLLCPKSDHHIFPSGCLLACMHVCSSSLISFGNVCVCSAPPILFQLNRPLLPLHARIQLKS